MPPYPQRYTSPQPVDRTGRPSSPTKRSGPQKYSAPDQRERWASISQMQNPIQQQGPMPPQLDARYSGNADQQYPPYGHERGAGGYSADEMPHDVQFDPGHGFRDMPYGGYDQGFGNAAHGQMPSGSMSPRSLMQYHQQQQQRIQQQQHYRQSQQQPPLSSQHLQGSQSVPMPATNLGSGLMSNSGQPAEEITTIFIVGFPDDMTEREFSNMFLFARGFEASTLKVPGGGPLPTPGGDGSRSVGRGDGSGGPGGPYQAVMPGANHFDLASNGGWDEHSLNMALGRQTNDSSFGMNALNLGDNGGRGGPSNVAGAGKIKQIIGFAKFRSRGEALEARDALNGKKIDSERGCVLKTEMAKKNLHTKQRPVLSGIGQGPPGSGDGGNASYGVEGPRSAGASVSSAYPSSFASNGGPGSFDAFARAGGPPSSTLSALSGMISPQGQNDPFGADFLRGTGTGSGMSANARSGSSGDSSSTGPKGSGGEGAKWSSMGPLDYFGPPAEVESQPQGMQATRQRQATLESKAGGSPAVTIRPHSQSQSSVNPGLGSGSSAPRGPDWSAIGSPPSAGGGGLFASARPFASSKDRPSVSSTAAPFVPQTTSASSAKKPQSEEDFGQGESTMSSTTKESEREGDSTSSKVTSPSDMPTLAPSSTSRSPRGPGNASSAFAARFGSLRLDSPNTITNPSSPPRTEDCNDGAQSSSPKQVEEQSTRSTVAPDASTTTSPTSRASKSPTMPDLPTSPTSRSFSIDQNPPGNTLFVGNLPASVTPSLSASLEKQLRIRFSSRLGYRQLSYRLKNNGPMCFVEFDTVQNAARALSEVNGDTMDGMVKNGGLRLSFSKNPLFRKDSHSTGSSSTNSTSPHSPAEQTPIGQGLSSLGKAGESLVSAATS
ncbi:hypothetical protein BCV69DRAFT_59829 [Microstroma glucosiphilum]|uniref:RRM domain-containing protein n=1 Tax=Pseudomicrostroma glucosiphilum TaxID=1684307 RepID=A0A316U2P0_9BASI|nr:hypothetical protein BCV69DRAFT_59829 [Pseudomicrostroma glucosiphilum]PWN19074.1 hypothetical protein BCV69DRAFT_59829 [Pseudomicrostroma glucosiphilum]